LKFLRSVRFIALLSLLTALFSIALTAGYLHAAPLPTHSGTGQALALRAALRALVPPATQAASFRAAGVPTNLQRGPDGRFIYDKPALLRSGAIRKNLASSGAAQVNEAVQTFDVFNPPPGFTPTQGPSLTPVNMTPVWTADETMLIFSSNRTVAGAVGGRFHLWAIPINGGAPIQLTDSTGVTGGGEFFPTLSAGNNQQIAFTSDANSSGTQNLYTMPFTPATVNVATLSSPTIRTDAGAIAAGGTGFTGVQRPAFSSSNSDEIIFSALSTSGTYAGHYHLYYLYVSTGGYSQATVSLPAKITDGPADDTDPAYSQDGQLIAFASTSPSLAPTSKAPSPDPNSSLLLTTTPGTNRNIFLIGGGSRIGFSNVTNVNKTSGAGQPVTAVGMDNFGPAWSSTRRNPYLNPAPGAEYIAFARGASPTAAHDIYYLQVLQNIDSSGQSGRSNEAASTPLMPSTPVYQINAGGPEVTGSGQDYASVTTLSARANRPVTLTGGTADAPNPSPVVNLLNDPGTPPAVYNTDESGTFAYTFKYLTPQANYRVRLHLSDPKNNATGARLFSVTINGQIQTVKDPSGNPTTSIDIVQQAQASPGNLDGLVTDSATGTPIGGATITVTDYAKNTVITTPNPLTTSATPSPSPTGTGGQINYTGTVAKGTYIVTVTPPAGSGYGTVSQVVNVNSGFFARADFTLSQGTGTVTGIVTDTNKAPVVGATVTFTDVATGVAAATAPATVTTASSGSYTATLAPGNYYVTVTPPAGSGIATQTQQIVVTTANTTAAPAMLNFSLATGAGAGTVAGLVTDSVSNLPLAGATIKVLSGTTIVAILTTSGGTPANTPAPPTGDGKPANYIALLPTGTYSFQFSASGYAPVSQSVVVVNTPAAGTTPANSFVRADKALVNGTPNTGQNTAVVETFSVVAPAQPVVDANGVIIAPKGGITVAFNPVSGDPPIVQAIEIISDSNDVASSGFGDLTTTTTAAAPTIVSALGGYVGGQSQITLTFNAGNSTSVPTSFNIYRSAGTPTSDNTPPLVSPAGSEGVQPLATIPGGLFPAPYVDTTALLNVEYYYQISAVYTESVTPETGTTGNNPAIQLNTDDNPGETSANGNVYDDIYPTWSPFITVFSIAYSSNRTITYNDPANNGAPSETAVSIGRGGSLGTTGTVGASYAGILESQLLNLDPPTLLPYSGNEVIHVTDAAGNTTRTGITPGQPVTFTVRLSSREAGIDYTGGPNGKPNVYIQIKDPDSKYQDSQGMEHKVFARDSIYRSQANNPLGKTFDSGSSAILMNGGSPTPLSGFTGLTIGDVLNADGAVGFNQTYSGYNGFKIPDNNFYNQFPQRGEVGGVEGAEGFATAPIGPAANKSDTISVGIDGGGANPGKPVDAKGKPVLDTNKNTLVLPGSDPSRFIPVGPEYECQVVNPLFAAGGTGDTAFSDYSDPYYLAGVDDQQPFSGFGKQRPTTSAAGAPAEWLQLTKAATQDNQGGVLYTATWTTPTSASDYYLDVIAFDKAVPPLISSFGVGGQGNWRIYDNVWGFSTASTISNNDILVVNDYGLGQKFAATTFGGAQGLLNLIPKLYGTESYLTDIDISLLPNAIYRTVLPPGAYPKNFGNYLPEVLALSKSYNADGTGGAGSFGYNVLNGLGVGSYDDPFIEDGGVVDGVPSVRAQQYTIWRILSRGPVPASLYKSYEPTLGTQPAVNDPGAKPSPVNIAAGTVAAANRCIVWLAPYTGDVLAGPGTLTDSATQAALTSFVAAGGRLCISGQDVGSALTQGGTVNNDASGFLSTVLGATLKTTGGGTHLAVSANAADSRLTITPYFDNQQIGVNSNQEVAPDFTHFTVPVGQRQILVSNNYGGNIFQSNNGFGTYPETASYSGNWRTDGALDQLGPYIQPFPVGTNNSNTVVGQIDTVTPNATPNVHTDSTLAAFANPIPPVSNGNDAAASGPGGVGLIYSDNTGSGGNNSKVVYATFGLEGLSTEYYKQTANFKPNPDVYLPRNQRQNLLHNIVSYLRTGSITGTVRATSGSGVVGSGVPGVTVYVQDAYGVAIPGRGTFSATTDASGNFHIDGIAPGNYTLSAYRTGYTRATSNPGVVFTVEGDSSQSASLTISPATPGALSGTVTDGANPVPGATVLFTSTDGQTVSAVTNTNGQYTLPSVPQGTYTGIASKTPGFSPSAPQTVTVTGNSSQTVNFILKPGPGTATGRVIDINGNPIPGATIFFSAGSPPAVVSTATTGKDGTYTTVLSAGSYTVTATAPGFGTSAAINIVVTGGATVTVPDIQLGPVSNGSLGGLITGTSTTTPIAGVAITITNPVTGQTVTATSGTVTAAPDGSGSINYGPITLAAGNYTVSVTKNGIAAGSQSVTITDSTFTRLDFTGAIGLPPLHTFAAGLNFLSAPYDYSSSSFDTLFGPLNTAATGATPNGNRSHVAVWDPTANSGVGAYAVDPSPPADAFRLGVGYWVFLKNGASLSQPGGTPAGASVSVALHPFWNQIGVPSTTGVAVSSLTFDMGAGTTPLTFASAVSSSNHVVSPTLYSYDGHAYQPVTSGDTLQPYQAYWIKVFVATTVHIPTGK